MPTASRWRRFLNWFDDQGPVGLWYRDSDGRWCRIARSWNLRWPRRFIADNPDKRLEIHSWWWRT